MTELTVHYAGPVRWPGAPANAPDIGDQLAEALGAEVTAGIPLKPTAAHCVFLSVRVPNDIAETLPGGNAFAACRALKQDPRVHVYVLRDATDELSEEVARFCMANSVLTVKRGTVVGLDELPIGSRARKPRVSTDALLERLERDLASDEGRKRSAVQRILSDDRQEWVAKHLTDPETGVFSAPFASFKLDEEFKRAVRFHHPLAMVLLDLGDVLPKDKSQRQFALAEASSVFLNECRDIDILARFTETTFLFLLPGTGIDGARVMTRRMLDGLLERGGALAHPFDACAGIVTAPTPGLDDPRSFVVRAEARLRAARQGEGEDGLCATGP